MIGYVLSGRYEILETVGGGGMAIVYKAFDNLLNRNVAVKVLREQYANDDEFIRRFRREAQSAAALSHPNVVSIYDVGQYGHIQYIVMEFVDGQNLNEIIKERAPLQVDEAVKIASQICDALEHAHQNQIIHRDIKPHNIMISKLGRIKVTDFGIARAVTTATITQTGSVLGSVHYFSPEHAKGANAGEQSDLYSLGIVLYQMVTGKLPFSGETPVSVALKHLQETFEEPRQVNPMIPQSVENVILRALRKSQVERYATASEMLQDLSSCLQHHRLREDKVKFEIDENDAEMTRIMPAIKGNTANTSFDSNATQYFQSGEQRLQVDTQKLNKRVFTKPVIFIVTTILIVVALFFGAKSFLNTLKVAEIDVPYVVGKSEEEARALVISAGLKIEEPTVYTTKEDVKAGVVYDQSKQNVKVKLGSFVKLYVSSGPQLVNVEDYSGQLFNDVKNKLMLLGVSEDQISKTEANDDDSEAGEVIGQTPTANTSVDPKTTSYTFIVSKGPELIAMPNLIGLTEQQAIKLLESKGLKVDAANIIRQQNYVAKGNVIEQSPYVAGDEVAKGTVITITVSDGLPADALKHTFSFVIDPATVGTASNIRIVYSDARGEDVEWGSKSITSTSTFTVTVVLAPNSEGRVQIYRDGKLVDSFAKTYDEVSSGDTSSQETIPGG